jgi:hypothetical protein
MKPGIAIPLGVGGISAGIGTAFANANGVFTGHPSLAYWFWGASCVLIALAILGWLANSSGEKKDDSPTRSIPPVEVRQENKQIVNQQFHFGPDDRSITEKTESKRHDQLVLQYIQEQNNQRSSKTHLVADVASGVGLTFHEADQSLKRLYDKGFLYRNHIDAPGDFVYWYRGPE